MENISDIHSQSNIRSHIALAVVTLILAIILLVLVFVPRPARIISPDGGQFQTAPGSGSQVSPSNSQGYTGTGTSAIVSGFVIPPLAL
jgi:hypothetical protein